MSADHAGGPTTRRMLTGWGRTAPTAADVVRPADREALVEAVRASARSHPRGIIARGLGRSYGDPAQNAGGLVVDTTHLTRVLAFDAEAGTVTVEAGVHLDDLLRVIVPRGWFVPVTPGTRNVTVGGMVAADVHGKNHHRDGSLGRHVTALRLVLADGRTVSVAPGSAAPGSAAPGSADAEGAELFWATLGGMGLTGMVLEVTMQLLPVQSAWVSVDTRRVPDLDALLFALEESEQHRYSVAWVDCLSTGRHTGRGVVTSGEHAPVAALDKDAAADPFAYDPKVVLRAPPWAPPKLLNRWTVTAFNEAVYLRGPGHRDGEPQRLAEFFHPLDVVDGWNALYGRPGFVQYQCVVPDEKALRAVMARLRNGRAPSFLAVLKRFGAASPGPLSFPQPGWTLAVDLPADAPGLPTLLDRVDEVVAEAGGRVYLAKDARLRPSLLPVMYPDLDRWHAVRARVDPDRRLRSDLSRRLSL